MRQVLRFEGPDGKGPCYGSHSGVFFSRYLAKMSTSAGAVPNFQRDKHVCAIDPKGFDWWCPPEALAEAESEGLNLCIYTVEVAYDEDPNRLYGNNHAGYDEEGRSREFQVVFDPEAVIKKVQLKPTEFRHELLMQEAA